MTPDKRFPMGWFMLTAVILGALCVQIVTGYVEERHFQATQKLEKADTVKIIGDIQETHGNSFTDYLTSYWTSAHGVVAVDFISATKGVITLPGKQPVQINVTAEDFPNYNLQFTTVGQKGFGYIRKIWNRNAVRLDMPSGQSILMYRYLPLSVKRKATIIVQTKKGEAK